MREASLDPDCRAHALPTQSTGSVETELAEQADLAARRLVDG